MTVHCPNCRTDLEIRVLDVRVHSPRVHSPIEQNPVFGEGTRVYWFDMPDKHGVIIRCGSGRVLVEWPEWERSWCAVDYLRVCE